MVFELPDEQPVEVTSPVTVSDQARHDLRSLLLLHHALGPLQERVVELRAVVRAQRRQADPSTQRRRPSACRMRPDRRTTGGLGHRRPASLTSGSVSAAAALTSDELVVLLRQAGRGTLPKQAARLAQLFAAPQLRQPAAVEHAMGQALIALVTALRGTVEAVRHLEVALQAALEQHPHAPVLDSLPGLGVVLAPRLLAKFGDDPERFAHAQGRRAYAGTAPVTRASGKMHAVVLRRGGNRRLVATCRQWAYSAITVSPGTRTHYDRRRAAGDRHEAALNLANKLVGQLDHCLRHDSTYLAADAWPAEPAALAA